MAQCGSNSQQKMRDQFAVVFQAACVITIPAEKTVNQIDLNRRHAVITGGGQGIGFAIAERLVTSGASVSLWDRDAVLLRSASEQLRKAGTITTETLDVSDAESVQQATARTIER